MATETDIHIQHRVRDPDVKEKVQRSKAEVVHLDGKIEVGDIPHQRLLVQLAKTDSEKRTAEMTWYTGTTVRRYGWAGRST